MRIHTDHLTGTDLVAATVGMPGVTVTFSTHDSRARDHAFEVSMVGKPGKDRHGITRRWSTGGAYGTTDGTMRALTWVEWGDWICAMFQRDPKAIIGEYEGAQDFIEQTCEMSYKRPERENAVEHAERWWELLAGGGVR